MTRLAISYALGILVFLILADCGVLSPVVDFLAGYHHLDKLVHFVMYGTLAFVVNGALAGRPSWSLGRAIATGSTIVLIASSLDEYSNILIPQRGWSLGDLAANCLGIACLGALPWIGFTNSATMRIDNAQQHEC
jgi:VanZ family protein